MNTGWSKTHPPAREAALRRIENIQPGNYARTRNHLQGAVTGLSPYITHGVITLRDVLSLLTQREPLEIGHKLVYELGWRAYFRHVWADEGPGIFRSLRQGPLPEARYEKSLPADVRQAQTGIPAIDTAVRTLYAEGLLHNHARMWLASYVVHIRRVHWRTGADWLVSHLLDGDLASNHLSWQWVAGTASPKPYLFNADNVARFAPQAWHSAGTAIDRPYEQLEAIARGAEPTVCPKACLEDSAPCGSLSELVLQSVPPSVSGIGAPDVESDSCIRGREVWLVHPWALRPPPSHIAPDAVILGVYPLEHLKTWPWPLGRWQWVDAAMSGITTLKWFVDAPTLATALQSAARVRSVADPHLPQDWSAFVHLDPEPTLFMPVGTRCHSFSQWWRLATAGLKHAEDLL
jgi:deoxyribodipyrimidine photo-lyase